MNKNQLINSIAETANLTKKDTETFLSAFVDVVKDTLSSGEEVSIVGLGKFETRKRAERKGRNPKKGTEILIPETVVPAFKPSKQLKDAVKL